MNKNIKIIIWIIILILLILFLTILLIKSSKTEKTNENFEKEVESYNYILQNSKSVEDRAKCFDLEIQDIQDVCVSSIEKKYWDMSQAQTLENCEKIKATETETKEFRVDVCKYNLIKKMDWEENVIEGLCWQINNKDVKNVCLANFKK